MRRTSVEIDEAQLARAQEAFGTKGVKDTIARALDEAVRAELRRRLAQRIRSGEGVDRGDELLAQSRRWQR
jgi:Arc/MetJ family transcription regulator